MRNLAASDQEDWRSMTRPPTGCGVYAVRGRRANRHLFAVYLSSSRRWSAPQSQLRAFDATPGQQPAYDMHDYDEWRELTDAELMALSPTFQAWIAGFLQPGTVVMPDRSTPDLANSRMELGDRTATGI
jgi:hypothetical protein